MGRGDQGSENQEGAISFETLRDEGQHFVHVQQFDKAIESFTKALELKPDDQHCLVTRSKCYLQVGNAESSLADAESALEQNKQLTKGLYQKAEALYQKGDFETALVYYHRGHRLRPELQEFRLGIQKSQEAINNSVGSPSTVKLHSNKGDMSYFYKQEEAKKQQRGGYQKPTTKREERKEREAPKSPDDAKTVKQLLGELYGDKEYLEKLLRDQSLTGSSSRKDMSREIKDKVCDGLEYLYGRADFWRQQKPMYARRSSTKSQTGGKRNDKQDDLEYVLQILEDIDIAQNEGKYEKGLKKAKEGIKIVEKAPDHRMQNKPELLATLNSSMGNAYLEMDNTDKAMEYHKKDLAIAREHNLEDAKSRALDNLGRTHARRGEFEYAIEVWEEKLPYSKSPLESTWLYHEIGRCYLELAKYSEARDYGEKSLAAAQEADDDGWQLHASVLVAQSEVKLGDYQAAADSFEKSLELARRQQDTAAEDAVKRALSEVNEKIVKGVKDEEGDEVEEEQDTTDKEEVGSPSPPRQPSPRQPTPQQPTLEQAPAEQQSSPRQQDEPATENVIADDTDNKQVADDRKDENGDQQQPT